MDIYIYFFFLKSSRIYHFCFSVRHLDSIIFLFIFFCFFSFFFNFIFYFLNFKIFNSYMHSQTWTPLPPPSPQHLSGSSPIFLIQLKDSETQGVYRLRRNVFCLTTLIKHYVYRYNLILGLNNWFLYLLW